MLERGVGKEYQRHPPSEYAPSVRALRLWWGDRTILLRGVDYHPLEVYIPGAKALTRWRGGSDNPSKRGGLPPFQSTNTGCPSATIRPGPENPSKGGGLPLFKSIYTKALRCWRGGSDCPASKVQTPGGKAPRPDLDRTILLREVDCHLLKEYIPIAKALRCWRGGSDCPASKVQTPGVKAPGPD